MPIEPVGRADCQNTASQAGALASEAVVADTTASAPAHYEADFLDAYNAGFHLYTLRSNVNRANSAIASRERDLERIEDEVDLKEAQLIAKETTTAERAELLIDLKNLHERTGKLESEIRALYETAHGFQVELGELPDRCCRPRLLGRARSNRHPDRPCGDQIFLCVPPGTNRSRRHHSQGRRTGCAVFASPTIVVVCETCSDIQVRRTLAAADGEPQSPGIVFRSLPCRITRVFRVLDRNGVVGRGLFAGG